MEAIDRRDDVLLWRAPTQQKINKKKGTDFAHEKPRPMNRHSSTPVRESSASLLCLRPRLVFLFNFLSFAFSFFPFLKGRGALVLVLFFPFFFGRTNFGGVFFYSFFFHLGQM